MRIEEILRGESLQVEFKETLPSKSIKYMKTVVAFSNAQGGRIYFGVRDDHVVTGISSENIFKTMDAITTAIGDSCYPPIYTDISTLNVEDKSVIVVDVPAGRQRPYYIKSQGLLDGVYVRVNGTTRPADRSYIQELTLEDSYRYYDQMPEDGSVTEEEIAELCTSMHDMAVRQAEYLGRSKDIRPIHRNQLLSWGVLAEKDGKIVPTHAFSLLTGRQGGTHAKVQCGVFRGKSRALLVNRQEFFGPLQEQAVNVYEYLLAKIDIRTIINGLFRQEVYEFPKASLREAVVNAIVHRSYLEGRNITVFLYDDRLEITSPGGLLRGVTVDRMREGFSKVRNRALASAFTYMNFIDEFGSGIPRILSEFEKEGLPAPQLQDHGDEFRFIFPRAEQKTGESAVDINDTNHDSEVTTGDSKNDSDDSKNDSNDSDHDSKIIAGDSKNDTNACDTGVDARILEALQKNPSLSQAELAKKLRVSTSTIARHTKKLQQQGKLKRIGNRRNGSWLVQCPGK